MSRRPAGRATRQILSGSQLAPPSTVAGNPPGDATGSFAYRYLLGLSALVIVSALIGVVWGPAPASALLLVLAIGLIASWLVV